MWKAKPSSRSSYSLSDQLCLLYYYITFNKQQRAQSVKGARRGNAAVHFERLREYRNRPKPEARRAHTTPPYIVYSPFTGCKRDDEIPTALCRDQHINIMIRWGPSLSLYIYIPYIYIFIHIYYVYTSVLYI